MRNRSRLFICCLVLGAGIPLARGQTPVSAGYGGIGDPSQAPRDPRSSYALTGIDHVNYYTGSVNVAIPILTIGGRGNVSRTIAIPIQRQWSVDNLDGSATPDTALWNYLGGFYTSGYLSFGTSSPNPSYCYNASANAYYGNQATSYIVWINFDGTQTILTDTKYHGQPEDPDGSCNPADRGTVFQSTDGSDLTFIATSDVHDGDSMPNGTLFTRDGTKYVTDLNHDGYVDEIQDRNGNKIDFSFSSTPSGGIYTVTDPVGRQTNINFTEDLVHDDQDVITYPGFNNATRTIKVNYTLLGGTDSQTGLSALASGESLQKYNALFPDLSGASSSTQFNPYVITSIVLTDNTSYRMQYNSYGELVRLTLSTGSVYTYKYSEAYAGGRDGVLTLDNSAGYRIYRPLLERDEYADGVDLSAKMVYSAQSNTAGPRPFTEAIVKFEDPTGKLLREEGHYFYGNALSTAGPPPANAYADWWEGLEYRTDVSDGSSVLQSVQKVYQQRPWDPSETDPWFSTTADAEPMHDPQLCQVNTTTDGKATSGAAYSYDRYNNPTDIYEFDFGHAPAIGSTCPSVSGAARHTQTSYLNSTPYTAVNLISLPTETKIMDGSGNIYSDTQFGYDETNMANAPNVIGHDNGIPAPGVRGNLTTVKRCLNPGNCTWENTSYVYDITGNVVTVTDPNNHATSYSYSDNYSDGQSRNTYAHVTAITNALGQSQFQANYDYGLGKPELMRDWAGQYTTNSYGSSGYGTDQLVEVSHPNGGHTYYTYVSPTDVITQRDQNSPGDGLLKSEILYDGSGRESETRKYESASGYISTTKSYDPLGRVSQTTNPSRPGDGLNYATKYTYDGLGRATQVTAQDGSVTKMSYSGNSETITDPAGHSKTLTYDGLGRLTSVADATGTTTYSYDPNGNLTRVFQGGEIRTFAYDSLSRLVQAENPESGTISYSYDPVGNLLTKTDARGVTTTYTYDALNRVTNKTYSDGTSAMAYAYDEGGHLTSVGSGNSTTNFLGFDAMGNVTISKQMTAGQTYGFAYSYDLAGSLTSEAYPSERMVKTAYDGAERAKSVTGELNGQQTGYVTSAAYYPSGALDYYQDGNGVIPTWLYNNRLQVSAFWADLDYDPNRYLLYLVPNWGGTQANNGNLQGVTEYAGGPGPPTALTKFSETFGYDGANRLISATDSGGWSRSYGYDQYGNMWVTGASGVSLAGNTPTSNVYNSNSNRISGASYDAAGNQLVVNGDTLSYDAENRMTSAYDPITHNTESYIYDGNGQRVQKTGPGGTTTYVYDAFGNLAAEYGAVQGNPPCATCYLAYDHLGSVCMVTDQNGNVVARHDFLPFGEEMPANTAGRNGQWGSTNDVEQKFTGQIRDNETGMDFFAARYYGSALGRFTSPDEPLVDQYEGNPQSWNLYSYVRNNPLRNIDPTGNACVYSGSGDLSDSSSYYDDGSGGQSCADAFSPPQNNEPSDTVYGQEGNPFGAFGLNLGFELSDIANSYFNFIAPNSQLLSQTPPNREFTGQLATGVAMVGTALIGPEGEAGDLIKVTEARLTKVLQAHTEGGLLSARKSLFNAGEDVKSLIQAAAAQPAIPQAGGNFERIVDAGRNIGIDRSTGGPTSVYTVITDQSGNLITAFPGRP